MPLRPTLVSVVVVLIVAGAGTTGTLGYISSTRATDGLFTQLADSITRRTSERTLRYLEPAVPYVDLTRSLARRGRLDTGDPMRLLDHFEAALDANPEFAWASYGSADGSYVAMRRLPDGSMQGVVRTQGEAGTTLQELVRDDGGEFRVAVEETGHYDPRERPWYQAAAEADGGVWVEPFLFATTGEPGFMYAEADRNGSAVRGVWAVEYEVSYLSAYLATLSIGEHGQAFVVTRTGRVVAHPDGDVVEGTGADAQIRQASTHPDPAVSGAWAALDGRVDAASFEFGEYLAMAQPLAEGSGIDWIVVVVVPEEEVFGEARSQLRQSALVAGAVALVAVLLGVYFANRVSGGLRHIAAELRKIGRFELDGVEPGEPSFFVRELNAMGVAAASMKRGLRSFARYVPRDLVRDLIRSGREAELGGEQAELTILFSDIAGFTGLAERMDPDQLVELLGEYLEALSDEIRAHGGTVDKFIGDAIMAFWGAPHPSDDHARRACEAALAMKRKVTELRERFRARDLPELSVRIGVNTGRTVVGNVGSPNRMNYTVLGDTVNLASRLEGLNKFYGTAILVGDATARAIPDDIVLRPVDWVAVKGRSTAELIHQPMGLRTDLTNDVLEAITIYREALETYRDRAFEDAARRFEEANERFGGGDEPSRILAERCRGYAVDPPDEDWDGRTTMLEK